MREIEKACFSKRIPGVLEALKKRKYEAQFLETVAESRRFILNQIRPGETVGMGGSVTLREDLALSEGIRERGNPVYDHWEDGGDSSRRLELKRKQRQVDLFMSGLNAVTSDGILVCLDAGGNRVAGLCSGPKRVIAVAGVNKLVNSIESAIQRTRERAAVLNAIRKNVKTPCVETGLCADCSSEERLCAALLILMRKPNDIDHFMVVLVNEQLGY